jgi:penicillin-insensitive murein DD-endopeptidase
VTPRSHAAARGSGALGASLFFASFAVLGCTRTPSPLDPSRAGSIGLPYRGCLTAAVEVPEQGAGYRFLRPNDRHFSTPRFASAIERAAAKVNEARPGSTLVIGDMSVRHGGRLLPHLSHRSGHDADLILYATTLDGAPLDAPDFVHYGADGLGWDAKHDRYIRFDVEREWLLVKALIEDPEARVEWMFANHVVEALLEEWAIARGEPSATLARAELVLLEPHPGGAHDDHIHVRTACSPEEEAEGCETGGPLRPWLGATPRSASAPEPEAKPESDEELIAMLLRPPSSP